MRASKSGKNRWKTKTWPDLHAGPLSLWAWQEECDAMEYKKITQRRNISPFFSNWKSLSSPLPPPKQPTETESNNEHKRRKRTWRKKIHKELHHELVFFSAAHFGVAYETGEDDERPDMFMKTVVSPPLTLLMRMWNEKCRFGGECKFYLFTFRFLCYFCFNQHFYVTRKR